MRGGRLTEVLEEGRKFWVTAGKKKREKGGNIP